VKLVFVTQVLDRDDAVLGFVPRWVEGLARACERVRVLALEVGSASGLPANVDVREIGRRGTLGRYLRYRRFLREAFTQDRHDALLAHMVPRYATTGAARVRGAGARSFLWYTHAAVDARLVEAERVVERIFTASEESLRLATPKKLVTGHGIDLAHFDARSENPAHPARLLSVGRITPRKDPLTLVAGLSILAGRGHDLALDLVGGGLAAGDEAYRRTLAEEIELGGSKHRVFLPGEIPYRDIPRWYRRATIFVSASRTGSVDKVVLEAMATGRPVVTSNDAFPALFAELGDLAPRLTFAPGDASELAERIEWLLALSPAERHAIGERLRAIVARDHEVDRLMARLVAEMDGVRA
jgi:glycosyltransferase involved in cell wall biosynthesis